MVAGRLHFQSACTEFSNILPTHAIERLPMNFQRKAKSAASLQPASLLEKPQN